jgi:hypothetical protein
MTRSIFSKWGTRVFLVLFTLGLAGCGDFKFTGTPPVDFGDVLVFTTSAPRTLTWRNAGTAHEVHGGRVRSPFAGVGTFASLTVLNNATVSLQFSFAPQAPGPATEQVKLITSSGAKSDRVALKGNGVFYISDGNITISETIGGGAPAQALDFGKVPVGTSKSLTISVQNTTAAAVANTVNWSLNNQGFTSAPANGAALPIPANAAATVTITFTPAAVGVYQDSVTIKDATGKIVSGIMVKGEGVKPE